MLDYTTDELAESDLKKRFQMRQDRLSAMLISLRDKLRDFSKEPTTSPPLNLREITLYLTLKQEL